MKWAAFENLPGLAFGWGKAGDKIQRCVGPGAAGDRQQKKQPCPGLGEGLAAPKRTADLEGRSPRWAWAWVTKASCLSQGHIGLALPLQGSHEAGGW